ncbi:MAG: twin-arginine translocase TatA/TatE family subunit [Acidimicrobiales bacterium]
MLAFVSDTGILVAVIAFVALFGASQIPKLARNLGEAGREFRKAHAEADTPAQPTAAATPALPASAGPEERVTLTRAQFEALVASPAAPAEDRP